MTYTFTLNGKAHKVSPKAFLAVAAGLLTLLALTLIGLYQLGGHILAIIGGLIVMRPTINDEELIKTPSWLHNGVALIGLVSFVWHVF